MLVGELGTAKSLCVGLLATAISGDRLTIQAAHLPRKIKSVRPELRPAYQSWSVNGSAGSAPLYQGMRRQNRPF